MGHRSNADYNPENDFAVEQFDTAFQSEVAHFAEVPIGQVPAQHTIHDIFIGQYDNDLYI